MNIRNPYLEQLMERVIQRNPMSLNFTNLYKKC